MENMENIEIRKNIYEKLFTVQQELKAPKNLDNDYGKYKYRSAESILEAVKPILEKQELAITLSDSMELIGDRMYLKATASVIDIHTGEKWETAAYAREPVTLKGMSDAQVTGATSSYARKYALNGLFAIDDSKDFDSDELRKECENRVKAEKEEEKKEKSKNKKSEEKPAKPAEQEQAPSVRLELAKKVKDLGLSNETVGAIIQQHYKKKSSKEMSDGAIKNMLMNLERFVAEYSA